MSTNLQLNVNLANIVKMLNVCFFGTEKPEGSAVVVPRQGNLLNPQDEGRATYITCYYSSLHKILMNIQRADVDVAVCELELNLQFIGAEAEMLALSTLYWCDRADVKEVMASYGFQLHDADIQINVLPYVQDGANTTLIYDTALHCVAAISYNREEDAGVFKRLLLNGQVFNVS